LIDQKSFVFGDARSERFSDPAQFVEADLP
jgi:hypothetical protein